MINNETFGVACCFKKKKKRKSAKNYENYGFKQERNLKHKNNFDSVKAFVRKGKRSLN